MSENHRGIFWTHTVYIPNDGHYSSARQYKVHLNIFNRRKLLTTLVEVRSVYDSWRSCIGPL